MRGKLTVIGLTMICLTSAVLADEQTPMTPEQRMQARYPQPVRVGDLIGIPLLDDSASTLGHVREVVRTKENKIELIVAYHGFLRWRTRLVAVPIEVVGIAGRHLTSLDMPRSEYAGAPTWTSAPTSPDGRLSDDATIKIALSRH
jgi:hypothetical protein